MRTPILYCLIGISGSGKSFVSKEMMRKDANLRIVGRDKIRELIYGYTEDTMHLYYKNERLDQTEVEVGKIQNKIIKSFIDQGKDVIIDNTHLRIKYLNEVKKNFSYCIIKYVLVDTNYDTCVSRDAVRKRSVGEEVIKKQAGELKTLKQNFDFKTYTPSFESIAQNPALPKAIVYDLDGTYALHLSGRGPYDYHRILEDTLSESVHASYEAYKAAGYKIIICTGREGFPIVIENSKLWLLNHNVLYDEFHIRSEGDHRPDYIVKHELWSDIASRYYIVALYDDRNQVVEAGRRLGLTVYQVADGDF